MNTSQCYNKNEQEQLSRNDYRQNHHVLYGTSNSVYCYLSVSISFQVLNYQSSENLRVYDSIAAESCF